MPRTGTRVEPDSPYAGTRVELLDDYGPYAAGSTPFLAPLTAASLVTQLRARILPWPAQDGLDALEVADFVAQDVDPVVKR